MFRNFGRLLLSANGVGNFCLPVPLHHTARLGCVSTRFFVTGPKSDDTLTFKKAPRGPYMVFSVDKMTQLKQNDPSLSVPKMGKMIGDMWRNLSEDEKSMYRTKYLEERKIYMDDKKKFMDSLTDEEKLKVLAQEQAKKKKKKAELLKKTLEAMNKPKPAGTNPFLLFVNSKMLERGDADIKMYVKGLSFYWEKMPEEDKQEFIEKARLNSKKYKLESAAWDRKMAELGRIDLIPKNRAKAYRKKPSEDSTEKKLKSAAGSKTKVHKIPVVKKLSDKETQTDGTQTTENVDEKLK